MKTILASLLRYLLRMAQPDVERNRGNIIAYLLDEKKNVISAPADAFIYLVDERQIVIKSELVVLHAARYKFARLSICYNGKVSFRTMEFEKTEFVRMGDTVNIDLNTHFNILENRTLKS